MPEALHLRGLRIAVGDRVLVEGIDLSVQRGGLTALVGRSGSGKSLTARSLLGLVDLDPGVIAGELQITLSDRTLRPYEGLHGASARRRDRAFAEVRGAVLGYLPQDCRAALDPLARVGPQVARCAALAGRDPDPIPWLAKAQLPSPKRVARLYPHELSGGMAQRVVIAQALARGSRFLLADEPTSALDPTVQDQILRALRDLVDTGLGVLLITHDLRVLPGLAEAVVILHEGRVAETTTAEALTLGRLTSAPGRQLFEATARVAGGVLG
ncbi:MAG: ABC transporter ATP-binding protein [Deltaproteobacteria bacterium]|nr:MAG: ABC transporter ATP-binding protein [Deltaproteobacteria bacterium]